MLLTIEDARQTIPANNYAFVPQQPFSWTSPEMFSQVQPQPPETSVDALSTFGKAVLTGAGTALGAWLFHEIIKKR